MDDDLRILVLEDEDGQEDLIEYELSKSNLRFLALRVSSREAFLHALQQSSPNLILVTTGHAEIGGPTALALAQEFCPGTPCFLLNSASRQKSATGGQEDSFSEGRGVHSGHLETAIASFFEATGIAPLVCEPEAPLKTLDALQPLLQGTGVIITFLSLDGRILDYSQGTECLTGWRRHEILGQDGIELFFPGTHRISATAHLRRVLSGTSDKSIDLPLKVRQGVALPYRWYCNLVSDGFGQPSGIMLVGQLLSEAEIWESLPRTRLARSCPSPAISRGRGLLTRRIGTC
jgi:PAS domain-containing protein